MQYLDALRYYCSPDAERETDAYRLTQIINLVNALMPILDAAEMSRQAALDFDAAIKKLEGLQA